ncbi:MAG: hypothetical protein HC819_00800 [Cyclobacteriaceae bacterium]|nr:hypothetical protein [Cyclobacteriaceae bacterium]
MERTKALLPSFTLIENFIASKCQQKAAELNDVIKSLAEVNRQMRSELEQLTEPAGSEDFLKTARDYQARKIALLSRYLSVKDEPLFGFDLDKLYIQLDAYLKTVPAKISLEQDQARFFIEPQDAKFTKWVKAYKLSFYRISTVPLLLANVVLKIFGRKQIRVPFWKYRLPLRLLTEQFVKTVIIREIDVEVERFSKALILILKNALDKEQEANKMLIQGQEDQPDHSPTRSDFAIDLSEESTQIAQLVATFGANISSLHSSQSADFLKQQEIAGTLELPLTVIRFRNRSQKQHHIARMLEKTDEGWGHTAFGLMEDWKIDQELFLLILQIRIELLWLKAILHRNKEILLDYLEKSIKVIKKIKTRLHKRLLATGADPAKEIKKELKALDSNLVQPFINPAQEKLLSQDFISSINAFELKIEEYVSRISEKRWLTKFTSYDKPLRSSDLDSFSPFELISYKYLPELREASAITKSRNTRQVGELNQEIGNIANVIAFNINTILESNEIEDTKKEAPRLMEEGMDRSRNKLAAIMESLKTYEKEILGEFDTIVTRFIASTLELTSNENAFNLRIIVTKAKAIQRTVDVKNFLQDKAKWLYAGSRQTYKAQLKRLNQYILPWKRRFGILEHSNLIATELSDFLSEAFNKINSLPVVYQRLYRIQPLTEMNLFTGRKMEMLSLEKAFTSWKDGKYAPTVIIGEKWSGQTSLINFFIDRKTKGTKVIYENRRENLWSAEDFVAAWRTILKQDDLATIDSVIAHINEHCKNTMIIIENIQNYYLRSIRGFEGLHLFVKLISKTYRNVFWLCSANIYAWEYLDKTIELSNYFGYHIKMTAFSDEELRQLIMKKNNISGYKIIFEVGRKNLESKKFMALDEHDKQIFLQNQFFNRLNEFAKGNISLALSYWLLSTKNINEHSIEISDFEPQDFSFISLLNAEKVFLLYLLIMHDGLSLHHLEQILHKPAEKIHLLVIMLLDDGLLVEQNGWYEVNPLIYRHCINMLKSRNLIY